MRREIAVANPRNASFLFARWQQAAAELLHMHVLALECDSQIFPSSEGARDLHLVIVSFDPTNVSAKWQASASNGLISRVNECNRRQTDHATGKYVAIGVLACAAISDAA